MAADHHLTTTVSKKGQVTLPKALRDSLHWEPGTRLLVEEAPQGVLLKRASTFETTRPEDVFGCLQYTGTPKTEADFAAGVLREAATSHARSEACRLGRVPGW